MIVCLCFGISSRDIRELARAGTTCPDELARRCGAGDGCGSCRDEIREVLAGEDVAPRDPRLSQLAAASRLCLHEVASRTEATP